MMLSDTARSSAAENVIAVRGARTHNLKNVDVDLPRNRFVVITGVSGSGKSSLAFNTIFAEGQRRYLESLSAHTRQFMHQLERADVDAISGLPPTVCVDQRVTAARARSTLGTTTEIYDYLRLLYARAGQAHCPQCRQPVSQQSLDSIIEHVMSCETGRKVMLLSPIVTGRKGAHREVFEKICKAGFVRARCDGEIVDAATPPDLARGKAHDIEAVVDRLVVKPGIEGRLRESLELALKHGEGTCKLSELIDDQWHDRLYSQNCACPQCGVSYPPLEPRTFSFNSPYGACPRCRGLGHLLPTTASDAGEQATTHAAASCPECRGERLGPLARAVTFAKQTLPAVTAMSVDELREWFEQLAGSASDAASPLSELSSEQHAAAASLLPEILSRLSFLQRVGVGYLSLDRATRSLSGGEFQRARLASCLGSALVGVCYVLDEPTLGLHPRDARRLIEVITDLRDRGNSVLVVEHDVAMMRAADWVIDLGPGAGNLGGRIVVAGRPEEISHPESQTARYLRSTSDVRSSSHPESSGGTILPETTAARTLTPEDRCSPRLMIEGCDLHNLKRITAEIPLSQFVAVTGVSGSGKSSLIVQSLVPAVRYGLTQRERLRLSDLRARGLPCDVLTGLDQIERLVVVDQQPIGRSGRSTPATHAGLWDEIRRLMSKTRDARLRGFTSQRFSFQSSEGRCATCQGRGEQIIEMNFLPDVCVSCPACRGARFNPQTLAVRYRDLNVADILKLRVDTAAEFFTNIPKLKAPLDVLVEVGLGYLELGQPASSLSGGEAQRIKLAAELAKGGTQRVLYVLDEPTSGLHPADIERLLGLLRRLVSQGHSVIVVEHQNDVIAAADWEIELGPDGGAEGGRITRSLGRRLVD